MSDVKSSFPAYFELLAEHDRLRADNQSLRNEKVELERVRDEAKWLLSNARGVGEYGFNKEWLSRFDAWMKWVDK